MKVPLFSETSGIPGLRWGASSICVLQYSRYWSPINNQVLTSTRPINSIPRGLQVTRCPRFQPLLSKYGQIHYTAYMRIKISFSLKIILKHRQFFKIKVSGRKSLKYYFKQHVLLTKRNRIVLEFEKKQWKMVVHWSQLRCRDDWHQALKTTKSRWQIRLWSKVKATDS